MRERILKFIESEKMTAAEFADKIGVQRSSVSHVLNGRNNPGFAFIQKILEAFPSVNSRWLLTGVGEIYENKNRQTSAQNTEPNLFSTVETDRQNTSVQNEQASASLKTEAQQKTPISKQHLPPVVPEDREVTRVLIFYSDHTFDDFRPAK